MKLNLGCGAQVVDGWTNVDYGLGARLAKLPLFRALNRRLGLFNLDWDSRIVIHNLLKPFPWADESTDIIYTSNMFEHFTRQDGIGFLKECRRVLKKAGIVRIVVPDLAWIVAQYLDGHIRADRMLERLEVLYTSHPNPIKNRLAPFVQFPHKCMYDTPTLLAIMAEHGFDARSRAPFDSEIDDIEAVERQDRTINCVIVEGRKV